MNSWHASFRWLSLFTLLVVPLGAAAGESVERVRVDLDFDQLGLADGAGGPIVVEIHCRGGHPLHQVHMDGDVLVVHTRALPDARSGALDVSAAQGIGISFDGRAAPPAVPETRAPVAPAVPETRPPAAPAAPETKPPVVPEAPRALAPVRPAPPEPPPVRAPDLEPAVPSLPPPPPAPAPSNELSPEAARAEVMAAMEAAMAEARLEGEARMEEERFAGEYGTDEDNHKSSWVIERDL